MEMIDTGKIKSTPGPEMVRDREVADFLCEWYDGKDYVVGHTSGSTGTPKEIRLYKADMLASARLTNRFFHIREDAVLLLCLPLSYIAGKMMVVRALEAGAVLMCVKPSSHPLQELIASRQEGKSRPVTLAAMVPMQVGESLKVASESAALGAIRHLLVGGAAVPQALEKKLSGLAVRAYATYGMTETVSHVALRELNREQTYTALGEVRFSTDDRGCLVIRAPHLQARCFVTNDLVKLHDETRFEWLGRYDHVINSGGIKFSPEILERKMEGCISGHFFVTSRPDARLGEHVVLVLEGPVATPAELRELRRRLRACLHPYEMPKEVFCQPRFLRTSSGKVKRLLDGAIPVSWNDAG